tara:strand:- start:249 stop:536 length:288 start_codon:yes stop_codon:yes gene_type:complete
LIHIANKKVKKALWLPAPTQLLIQGQWWSNLSTHVLQIEQCLDLADLITLQVGQRSAGLMSFSIVMKLIPSAGFSTPAFLHEATAKDTNTKAVVE